MPAVFDRYSNAFLKIYFEIPEGREDEYRPQGADQAPAVGHSYGIPLKKVHCKFPQP